jgi:hypothetical protein
LVNRYSHSGNNLFKHLKMKYALFRRHRVTGEIVHLCSSLYPSTIQSEAEKQAKVSRKVETLSNTADEWETVALPEKE